MPVFKKVTMQTIADACGLSRNTVSKVFNNRGSVPDSTRKFVLAKARELNYNQFPEAEDFNASFQNIALLTHSKPMNHSFGSLLITSFSKQICLEGYNLRVFEIGEEDYVRKVLPSHFIVDEIGGIIAIELFDRDYTRMLCSLGIPTLLVDSYTRAPSDLMQCDMVYMENYASTIAMTERMIFAGARSIGFVGDVGHCSSFLERWNGFRTAVASAGMVVDRKLCILDDDDEPYGEVDWLLEKINAMPYVPDGFVCANDFIAVRIMQALRRKGLSVPEDVMVTGFDGSPEAEIVSPALTTACIPSAEIGKIAAGILLERIKTPDIPFKSIFVRTDPVWRESVREPIAE